MRKNLFLLLEIVIWIFVLGGLISFGASKILNSFNKTSTYQVVFKDVDNLSIGCPVRIMGIQIGHITEVKSLGDMVAVTFVLTDNNVSGIPAGSTVSIQFTGIAGSKSLEIEPPKKTDRPSGKIKILEPIRVNSLMDVQVVLLEAVVKFSKDILNTFGNQSNETIKRNIKNIPVTINNTYLNLHNTSNNIINTKAAYVVTKDNINDFISQQNHKLDDINNSLQLAGMEKDTRKFSKNLSHCTNNFNNYIENIDFKDYVYGVNDYLTKFNNNTKFINKRIKQQDIQDKGMINAINLNINKSVETLNQITNFAGTTFTSDNLNKINKQCEVLKNSTKCINEKFK